MYKNSTSDSVAASRTRLSWHKIEEMGRRGKKRGSDHRTTSQSTQSSAGGRTQRTPITIETSDSKKLPSDLKEKSDVNQKQSRLNDAVSPPEKKRAETENDVLQHVSEKFKNPDVKITLKDLVGAITKAASDRKKVAGSSKKDNELKEELSSLLKQIKMDDKMEKSPLASGKPLTNEEGLSEIKNLLRHKSEVSRKSRAESLDTSPTGITEALLDFTRRAEQGSDESESKEESGSCAVCAKNASTKCTGCRKVFYCSRDCQRNDWSAHKDACRPYRVGKIEGFGRVLVATRTINAEEEVLRERPFVVGPRPSSELLCLGCFRRVNGGYRCVRCSWPLCGERCSSNVHHAAECHVSKTASLKGPEELNSKGFNGQHSELITALRCLVAAAKEKTRWRTLLERFGARHSLVRHGSLQHLYHQQNIIEPLKSIFRIDLQPSLSAMSEANMHTVLNVLQVHSVPCRSEYGEVMGLYPMASLLGHSCVPNTRARIQGEHLVVTATETINAEAPITAMFSDILWGTKARRDHLLQTRFFSCSCRRCSDPTELGSYFSSLRCPKCPQQEPVLPTQPLVSAASWACSACGYQVSSEELLETNLRLGSDASLQLVNPSIEGLESLLEKWLSKVHTNHYHLHAVKHSLLQLYGRTQENEDHKDEAYWKEIAKKEKLCQEFLKVCSLLDPSMAHSVPQFGLAFYELHKTVLQYAKYNFSLAKLGTTQLKKKMQLAKALLRRSMDILKHEAEDTPEGQLYSRCQEEFIAIGKWMLSVGLA
ncbi:Zinc finger MYND-type [Trinorchestia longiramus]|nr:Zinc finger MYND-type [Trinorchestia longiramus]